MADHKRSRRAGLTGCGVRVHDQRSLLERLGLTARRGPDRTRGNSVAIASHEAAAQVCTDLNRLQVAYDDVRDGWDDVAESKATWDAAQKEAVKSAADGLKKTWDDLPDDTTGAAAATRLKPQAQMLDSAAKSARTGLKCPG
ncbi:hypothetical protein ABZZ17_20465 [Streptomyces sp. NPDC006512]|uniref:hypothetical protein n=1 Tax=Streptomyces sp. NPDC006512 TaxID=3154307 RepID=UPI0033B0DCEF